jgi:hypothetical protein
VNADYDGVLEWADYEFSGEFDLENKERNEIFNSQSEDDDLTSIALVSMGNVDNNLHVGEEDDDG